MKLSSFPNIEILENRIAPAVIFLSGTNSEIHGKNAAYSTQELAAKTLAASSEAVFLQSHWGLADHRWGRG